MTSSRVRQKWVAIGVLIIILASLLTTTAFADLPETTTVTIVSTNDFHGALVGASHSWSHGDVVGGLDYVTGYVNIIREENPGGVLWLDAGDAMQGTLISNYFFGASVIDAYNAAGIAAMAIGNHEFDWGQAVLLDRSQQADFPFLTSNVFTDKYQNPNNGLGGRPQWAKTYEVLKANGIKVGVIGISLPSTPSVTNPINVANLEFTDPVEAVDNMLGKVEGQSDMVVVLAHIGGYFPDFGELADFVCGLDPERVDLVVSGHTHSGIADVICGIPVMQSYSSGTALSRIDFEVDTATGEVVGYTLNPYPPITTYQTYYGSPAAYQRWDTGVWQEVVPDPTVAEIIAGYNALVADAQNEVIGETLTPITREYRLESGMGDWVTDIMKAYDPSIDFAFTNSGGLREDIDAGPITFGEVFAAMPFDNTLVVVELDGSEVRAVLEEGITGDHGVVQVSGLQFTFDYDAPVGSRIVGDVIDLATGLPLDPGTTYMVAVNDFMAVGGDDYTTLAANPQTNSYALIRDLMVDWVKANSPFSPPDPAVEMRITALGTPPP